MSVIFSPFCFYFDVGGAFLSFVPKERKAPPNPRKERKAIIFEGLVISCGKVFVVWGIIDLKLNPVGGPP
jgi:hypothetical protein